MRTMIAAFDHTTKKSTFQYMKHTVTVSFTAADFTRVFGIPGRNGKKVDMKAQKMNVDQKEHWIRMVSRNLTPTEFDSIAKTTKGRGMKKSFVA